MSAISACIHCCNLARSCIAAHIFPANSACACAQNCNCCTSIHLFNHLFWPTQAIWHPHIPYTTFPSQSLNFPFFYLLASPSLVSSSHVWVGDYYFQNPHHHQERVCLMGSSLLMHGERPLSATISSSGLHLLTLSTLGGHTLTLTPTTFIRTKK